MPFGLIGGANLRDQIVLAAWFPEHTLFGPALYAAFIREKSEILAYSEG